MRKKKTLTLLLLLMACNAFAGGEDISSARRIEAHLKIGDKQSAVQEAQLAANAYPDSVLLKQLLVKAFAKAGKEKECLAAWKANEPYFTDERQKAELLEEMAWGFIEKGAQSNSLTLKAISMLGATMTQDVYAVDILKNHMKDSNSLIREMAVELASYLNDRPLQREVLRLLEEEPVWDVRLQAILAAGKMRLSESEPKLKAILSDDRNHLEEKIIAATAIVSLREDVTRNEIYTLSKSKRAGLRLLACKMASEFDRKEDLDLIVPLLRDSRSEVRIEALNVLGLLRAKSINGKKIPDLIAPCLEESDYKVAITAAWVMALYDPLQSENYFFTWLKHPNPEVRTIAASALALTGRYGEKMMLKILQESKDRFVRVNIALGLLGQRIATAQAAEELYRFMISEQKLLMSSSSANRLFNAVSPSDIRRSSAVSETPEAADQIVRLELLRLLAVMGYPKTQIAMKQFLKEKNWEITGIATMLIEEGDEEAVALVRELLNDSDKKVRIQAALVLSMWARDSKAVDILQDSYATADRELKMRILEALGHIGAPQSVPFLIHAMQDPFAMLRISAATALILCLNH